MGRRLRWLRVVGSELLFGLLGVAFSLIRFRMDRERGGDLRLSIPYLALGITYSLTTAAAYDREVARIRSSRPRRVLFGLLTAVASVVLEPEDEGESASFTLDFSLGTVCYRLRFGVLAPVPGDRL